MDKFYKCDLHVHSSSCYSRSYTKEDFIKAIFESDIEVFSITDHNIIDKSIYDELKSKTGKLLILGTELNVHLSEEVIKRNNLNTSNKKYFHAILWFDINDIENVVKDLNDLQRGVLKSEPIDVTSLEIKKLSKKLEQKSFDLEIVQKTFSKYAYFFVPHEGKSDRNLSDYLPNSSESNIIFKQKLFYFNNRFGIEGKKTDTILDFFDKSLNTLIPAFYFSDAKEISEIGTNFTWINFNGDFNSLILPFSDPKTRVFKSIDMNKNPQKNLNDYLQYVKFNIGDKEYELEFSPGINGIIGARGSGKSLLANVITNQIDNYKSMNIKNIQFKMKDSTYLYAVPKHQYISQGYLSKLFDERDFRKIKYINDIKANLINKKKSSIMSNIKEVESSFEGIKNLIIEFINNKQNNYSFIDLKAYKENKVLIHTLGNLGSINEETIRTSIISKFDNVIRSLSDSISEIDKINVSFSFDETNKLKESIKEFKNKSIESIKLTIEGFKQIKDSMNDEYIKTLIRLRNQNLKTYKTLVIQHNGEINNEDKVSSENYENFLKYMKSLNKLRYSVIDLYNIALKFYENIFTVFEKDEFQLLDKTKIVITTNLEQHLSFDQLIGNYLKYENSSFDLLTTNILMDDFNKYYNKNKIRNVNNLNDLFIKVFDKLVQDVKQYGEIDIAVFVNDKNIEELSPGKQSEILLRIIIEKEILASDDNRYIVMDQPEDNLDTQTIVSFLVDNLRNLKLERQVFIVSHSAPLIVNSDSDLVISCKNDNRIDYITGNINDVKIRNSIVDVLDGGEKYLKMRVNKYDFNYKENKNGDKV